MNRYVPPFEITNEMLLKVSDIMEKIGRLDGVHHFDKMPQLRKQKRIHSIHSSLAIENNSLSYEQVQDVINGKIVFGPQKEIQEVKNAYNAYQMLRDMDPYSISDLKKIHVVMGYLTIEEAGNFRNCAEGVFDGDQCIFICPSEKQVPSLMNDLFYFLKKNKDVIHPLILSSIFHYEFVFIHPFRDGNGRTARLWQNIILYNFHEIFEYLPIESQICKYQEEYYKAIAVSHKNGNSNSFIEFMLSMIDKALEGILKEPNFVSNESVNVQKLLSIMDEKELLSANELLQRLGIKSKETLRKQYLDPALQQNLIQRTIPDKPTSKNQKYYKI